MKNRITKIVVPLILTLFLTGCWDSVEIDRKAFVSTVGIDVGADIEKKENGNIQNYNTGNDQIKAVRVTYNFPDIRNMDTQKGTTERLSLPVDGYSLTDAYIKAVNKASRSLHFGHSKLLVLSENLFSYPQLVNEFMDYIERTPSINRAMVIVVVEGKAEEYLATKPMLEDGIDNYITNLLSNSSRNGNFEPTTVTNYIDKVKSNNMVILPYFTLKGENDIQLTGGVMIQDYTIKDKFNNNQVDNIQLLNDRIGACKKATLVEGHPIDYYIENINTQLKVKYRDDRLYLHYDVETQGDLSGYYSTASSLDSMDIRSLESKFNENIEDELLETVSEIKNNMRVDILDIENNIKKYHPKIWKEIEGKWPDIFYDADISITVKNRIKTVGISN